MNATSIRSTTLRAVIACAVVVAGTACLPMSHAQLVEEKQPMVLMLRMSVSHGVHSVVEADLMDSPTTLQLSPPMEQAEMLNFAVTDSSGRLLVEGGMPDPRVIRGPMPPPGEPPGGHEFAQLDTAEYVLRLPYSPSMRYLKLAENRKPVLTPPSKAASSAASSLVESTTTIDLISVLPRP